MSDHIEDLCSVLFGIMIIFFVLGGAMLAGAGLVRLLNALGAAIQ